MGLTLTDTLRHRKKELLLPFRHSLTNDPLRHSYGWLRPLLSDPVSCIPTCFCLHLTHFCGRCRQKRVRIQLTESESRGLSHPDERQRGSLSLTHVEEADVLHGVDDDEPLSVAVGHQAKVGAEGEAAHLRRRHRVHVRRQAYQLRVVSGHLGEDQSSISSYSSAHFIQTDPSDCSHLWGALIAVDYWVICNL